MGIVLNPATPVSFIHHYIHLLDKITVMTVDPGYAGQPFIPEMVQKIQELKALKLAHGHRYLIEIDGSCNQRTYSTLLDAGAEVLIVGTSGLFTIHDDLATAWTMMRDSIDTAQGLQQESA